MPAPADNLLVDCPACGQRGRKVKPITLESLVLETVERPEASYRFSASVGCEVAWFGDAGHRIPVSASRVAIGQKSTSADRTLCYCFGHTAQDIAEELAATGSSTIPKRIADACKRGEDLCPEMNPQGSCCLGNVHAVLKASPPPDSCGCSD
jgi:hypothetical protein